MDTDLPLKPTPPVDPPKNSLNPILLLVILLSIVMMGLLGYQNYHLMQTIQSLKTVPSTTPTSTPNPTVNWKTYTNTKYNYSLKYPETWYDLPNHGAPDTDKYFSNENIGVPLEGDSKLIWLMIRVTSHYTKSQYDKITGTPLTLVDGSQVVKVIKETAPNTPTEYAYETQYFIYKDNTSYTLDFLSSNKHVGIENANLFDQILSTFTFTQ